MTPNPRVFISYSWDSDEHKDRVRRLAERLRRDGIDARIDQYDSHSGIPWPQWMREQIEQSKCVLMVFTPTYKERFEVTQVNGGLGVSFEGLVITQEIYENAGNNKKSRVVLLEGYGLDCVTKFLKNYTSYQPDTPAGYEDMVRWICDSPRHVAPPLGKLPSFVIQSDNAESFPPPAISVDLPEIYYQRRAELRDQCRTIPVFGRIMDDIPMEQNFINLSLEAASNWKDNMGYSHERTLKFTHEERLKLTEIDTVRIEKTNARLTALSLWQQWNKGAILGLPGAGKTTILRHFAHLSFSKPELTIVLVNCRSLRRIHFSGNPSESAFVFDVVTSAFLYPSRIDALDFSSTELINIRRVSEALIEALSSDRLVLLIDAYDETPTELRQDVRHFINALAKRFSQPHCKAPEYTAFGNRFFISARRHEMEYFSKLETPIFEINPLDMEQMRSFARSLFGEGSHTYLKFDEKVWRDPVLRRMGRTPLTALLLLCYFDIRGEFDVRYRTYDLVVKFILMGIWEDIKAGSMSRRREHWEDWFRDAASPDFQFANASIDLRYRALAYLCYLVLFESTDGYPRREISSADLNAAFSSFIKENHSSSAVPLSDSDVRIRVESWISDLRNANLLIATGDKTWLFVHGTVMEFLAAVHLVNCSANSEFVKSVARLEFTRIGPNSKLETLAIASGHSPEITAAIFLVLKDYFLDHNTTSKLQRLFSIIAESEALEFRLLAPINVRRFLSDMQGRIQPAEEARRWAYSLIADEINASDSDLNILKAWKEWLSPNGEILEEMELRLRRPLLPEIHFSDWWNGKYISHVEPQRMLNLLLGSELRSQQEKMAEQVLAEKRSQKLEVAFFMPDEVPLRLLDLSGDTHDKDFSRIAAICGSELVGILGSPNLKHGGSVRSVCYTLNGEKIGSGSDDGTVRIWDVESGRQLQVIEHSQSFIYSCAFSHEGDAILTAGSDGVLRLWEVATGRLKQSYSGHANAVRACAFSETNSEILSGSDDDTLRLWNRHTGELIHTFVGHASPIFGCAFRPQSMEVLSVSADRTAKLWDRTTGKLIKSFKAHNDIIRSCSFKSDGSIFLTCSMDGTLKLWDPVRKKKLRTIRQISRSFYASAINRSGTLIASGGESEVLGLWDTDWDKSAGELQGHSGPILACSFDHEDKIVSGSADIAVRIWSASNRCEVHNFVGHTGGVSTCSFSPSGEILSSGSSDHTLRLWNVRTGSESKMLPGHNGAVTACSMSSDGTLLLSGSEDGTTKIWDVATCQEIRTLRSQQYKVEALAFNPRGNMVLTASADGKLRTLSLVTQKKIRTFLAHSQAIKCCAFSEDGTMIISGSADKTLKIWNTQGGTLIRVLSGHTGSVLACCFFKSDNYILSASADNTMRLWEPLTGSTVCIFNGHADTVSGFVIIGEHGLVVSVSHDKKMKLWSINDGTCLRTWTLPFAAYSVSQVRTPTVLWEERLHFKPNQAVAVGLANGTILLFDLTDVY